MEEAEEVRQEESSSYSPRLQKLWDLAHPRARLLPNVRTRLDAYMAQYHPRRETATVADLLDVIPGERVGVMWMYSGTEEHMWYFGSIERIDGSADSFRVEYDDGDTRNYVVEQLLNMCSKCEVPRLKQVCPPHGVWTMRRGL